MIDLSANIRTFILSRPEITNLLPAYQNSKPVFTRRPAPSDVKGQIVMISPMVGGGFDSDFLDRQKREVTYDVACYGPNDTPANYRKVEQIGFALANAFHRLDRRMFMMPEGWQLVRTKAYGPMTAPTDDQTMTGRMISVQFLITQNTASF